MATAQTVQPTPAQPSPLPSRLGWGLLWAGLLAVLLTLWMEHKYASPLLTPVLGLAAAGYLLLAAWLVLTRWRTGADASQTERPRAVVPPVLLGLGILLLLFGLYFLGSHGLAALGEGAGLVLFGLVSAVVSRRLDSAAGVSDTSALLLRVQESPQAMGKGILGVSLILIALFWGLFVARLAGNALFPELLGLGLLVLTYAGIGMYLFRSPGSLSSAETRIVVLALGGLTGLSLFIAVLLRTFAWRDTTLFGGLAAWQGPYSWRIWLCAYLGMLSLALLSGSLLLARADIRTSPLLRRVYFGYNTAVTVLLLLLVLALANVVVYVMFPFQFDWTSERGIYALSENSKRLLHGLERKVTAYGLFSKGTDNHELTALLENCETEAPTKFEYRHLTLDVDKADFKELADRFPAVFQSVPKFGPVPRRGGVLVVYGEPGDDPKTPTPPHGFIPVEQTYKAAGKKDEARTREFVGEIELMKQLSDFVAEKRSRVYVLQDNGEARLETKGLFARESFHEPLTEQGVQEVKKYLTEGKYEVFGLSFQAAPKGGAEAGMVYAVQNARTGRKEVPMDAGFLLVIAPSRPYPPQVLTALEDYLERGGKLLVYFDVFLDKEYTQFINTGLEELLRKFGIEVTSEVVFAPNSRFANMPEVVTPTRPTSPLASAMKGSSSAMLSPRIIRPGAPGKFEVEVLLELEPRMYVTSSPAFLKAPLKYLDAMKKQETLDFNLTRTRLPVALSARLPGKDSKPQVYVFGDAEFISDGVLRFLKEQQRPFEVLGEPFTDRFSAHLEWVHSPIVFASKRPGFVGPRPRKITSFRPPADTNFNALALVPGWIMTITLLGLGAGVWVVRRR